MKFHPHDLIAVQQLIESMGDDYKRPGLLETPERVIRSFEKLYSGYKVSPEQVLQLLKEFDPEDSSSDSYSEIVLVKNIELYSTCEHHLLPFFGRCHIAYMPNKKVVGVSKLVRIMEVFARRLQIQERIGKQITDALMNGVTECQGAACIIEAQHFCMTSRGVEKQHSEMVTSSMRGCFLDNEKTRSELMMLIKG